MGDDVKVTLTLRGSVAARLKAMCHARGETASTVIDRWVFEHDDAGNAKAPPAKAHSTDDFMARILAAVQAKR